MATGCSPDAAASPVARPAYSGSELSRDLASCRDLLAAILLTEAGVRASFVRQVCLFVCLNV